MDVQTSAEPPPACREGEESQEATAVSLIAIFGLFSQIGLMSFGGGLSAWLYREVVDRRRWLSGPDFLSGLALGQVLPGINTANLSIYIGQRMRGVPGSVTAIAGLLSGPFFFIIGLAMIYRRIDAIPWMHNFLSGIAIAAVGLVISIGLRSIRTVMRGVSQFVVMTIIIVWVGVLRWPMVPVVLCLAPVSVWLAWRREGRGDAG